MRRLFTDEFKRVRLTAVEAHVSHTRRAGQRGGSIWASGPRPFRPPS
jgi:hypothetical protein